MDKFQIEKLAAAVHAYKNGLLHLAFDLYKQVADSDHVDSQVFVAWMLENGVGCAENRALSWIYLERAAALDNLIGCFYLGCRLTADGEHDKAFGYYSRGANCGYLPSMFRVGYSLSRGNGVRIDLARAYRTLWAAAVRGHALALREIASLDMKGRRGLFWMPLGVIEFFIAVLWGLVVLAFNRYSDLVRG